MPTIVSVHNGIVCGGNLAKKQSYAYHAEKHCNGAERQRLLTNAQQSALKNKLCDEIPNSNPYNLRPHETLISRTPKDFQKSLSTRHTASTELVGRDLVLNQTWCLQRKCEIHWSVETDLGNFNPPSRLIAPLR